MVSHVEAVLRDTAREYFTARNKYFLSNQQRNTLKNILQSVSPNEAAYSCLITCFRLLILEVFFLKMNQTFVDFFATKLNLWWRISLNEVKNSSKDLTGHSSQVRFTESCPCVKEQASLIKMYSFFYCIFN